jgi:hypothetical protein
MLGGGQAVSQLGVKPTLGGAHNVSQLGVKPMLGGAQGWVQLGLEPSCGAGHRQARLSVTMLHGRGSQGSVWKGEEPHGGTTVVAEAVGVATSARGAARRMASRQESVPGM